MRQRNGNGDEITPSKSFSGVRVLSSPRIDLVYDDKEEPAQSDDDITPIVDLSRKRKAISVNLEGACPQPPSGDSLRSR